MTTERDAPEILLGGRYVLADVLAAGGMATVHIGRLRGEGGFSRTVAIKRLHPQFVHNSEFVAMFLDEARIVARIRHPNVVPTIDVVSLKNELFLVMELVTGESLSRLLRAERKRGPAIPLGIASGVMMGALQGLHAAHEARGEQGEPLHIVHRDVSPQNILVGTDGIPRLIDFGVAKAVGQVHLTREGQIKGKVAYMSPEQLRARPLDRRSDVYAAGIVLWEILTCRRLFQAADDVSSVVLALDGVKEPPSSINPSLPKELDDVVMRALHPDPEQRYPTAREMALDLERVAPCASAYTIGAWVEELARDEIEKRTSLILALENSANSRSMLPSMPEPAPGPAPLAPVAPLALPLVDPSTDPSSPVSEHGASDISELSLASDPQLGGAQGRSRLIPSLVAVASLLGLAGWWLSSGAEPTEPASAAPPPSPPSASAPPLSSPPPAPSSAPSSSPSAPPTPRKGPTREKGDSGSQARPSKAGTDCSNPYLKGADGILRVKPGCL